jgi:hypothetical protein
MKKSEARVERDGKGTAVEMPVENVSGVKQEDAFVVFTDLVRNSLRNLYDQGIERDRVEEAIRKFEAFVSNINQGTYTTRESLEANDQVEDRVPGKELRPKEDEWYASE